jgi:hypothetical protein
MVTDSSTPDPIALLRQLTPEQVRTRLAELDAERRALGVVLRSLTARDRAISRHKEAADARR